MYRSFVNDELVEEKIYEVIVDDKLRVEILEK